MVYLFLLSYSPPKHISLYILLGTCLPIGKTGTIFVMGSSNLLPQFGKGQRSLDTASLGKP